MQKSIISGMRFFDEKNTRYLTTDGQGCDPRLWTCVVEELNEAGDFEITGRQNFMESELLKMREV